MSAERSLEECLFHWPAVIAAQSEEWSRAFALSIQKRARRPAWEPSQKQIALMRKMVAELFVRSGDGQAVVIDRN